LYECLTAERPFGEGGPGRQLRAHLHTPPPRPSEHDPAIPATLDAVVARGMAKDPDDRFPDGAALSTAVCAAVGLAGPIDRIAPAPHRSAQPLTTPPATSGPTGKPTPPPAPPARKQSDRAAAATPPPPAQPNRAANPTPPAAAPTRASA